MLRPKSVKRAPARRPFLTEGAPTRNDLRPYGARLRERLDPRPDQLGFGEDGVRVPPSWVLDKLADETISGRYTLTKNPRCEKCGVLKSLTGECFC